MYNYYYNNNEIDLIFSGNIEIFINMLNIIKLKLKNSYKKKVLNNQSYIFYNKDFIPTIRDWKNSIYVFNKNTLSIIPVASRFVNKLIKNYLNSYNLYLEYRLRKNRLRNKQRRLSTNKIFISNSEFKHTNDKISITLYIYNRQKFNYLLNLKKRYIRLLKKKIFKKRLQLINNIVLNILKKQKIKKNFLTNVLPNYNFYWYISRNDNYYYKNFIKKSFKKFKYYILHKQLIYINKVKFEYSYLQSLIFLVRKLYKKNIEFNIINLKYFFFNSDIFTQPLVLKLNKKRRLFKYLNTLKKKIKIKPIKLNERSRYFFDINNLYIFNNNKDITNNLLKSLIKSNNLKKIILCNIKYKRVSGFRLEASGRLTKRYTASRSQHKSIYTGNLENYYSSIKGYPSVVIRGNFKPNLQYTKLSSKTRIGSFGIKGWINGT